MNKSSNINQIYPVRQLCSAGQVKVFPNTAGQVKVFPNTAGQVKSLPNTAGQVKSLPNADGHVQLPTRAAGFTLIEVMIAVIVLSIGLLGVAGLQTVSQKYSRSAYLNTQATVLAHDMLERMRANPQGLLMQKVYDNPAATAHSNCFTLSGCSVTEMAENDMYEWADEVSQTLPGGKVAVCIDSTPDDGEPDDIACDGKGNQYAIKTWWLDINTEIHRVVTTASF